MFVKEQGEEELLRVSGGHALDMLSQRLSDPGLRDVGLLLSGGS